MKLFQRLSIRLRITLGSLLIAVLLLGIAVVVFRGSVESILNGTTETLLSHDAANTVGELKSNSTGTVDAPGRGQLVAAINPNGTVVQTTLPQSLNDQLKELLTYDYRETTVTGGDDTYHVLVQSVISPTGVWHVVSARNAESAAILLDRLTQALVAGALVLIFGFTVASWVLTGASLRPVSRMREQAEAIVALNSTEPLPTGVARDELSALGATLNEFISNVRKSVDRERQLVSDASHELRSPLAVLTTQLELAHLNSGDAAALEREISAAQRSVARLSSVATSLLELSQLESRTRDGESSWTELAAELTTSVDDARLLASTAKVTVDFSVSKASSPAQRYAISTSNFARLVANLANNAIAVVAEGGTVRLTLKQTPLGLNLVVADDGPGMSPDFIPVAFDRFSRPDDARARLNGGAGLGLAIVHAIVSGAHGTVTIANRRASRQATGKHGLIVTVVLPRKGTSRPIPV